jgi:hypothetical protein
VEATIGLYSISLCWGEGGGREGTIGDHQSPVSRILTYSTELLELWLLIQHVVLGTLHTYEHILCLYSANLQTGIQFIFLKTLQMYMYMETVY